MESTRTALQPSFVINVQRPTLLNLCFSISHWKSIAFITICYASKSQKYWNSSSLKSIECLNWISLRFCFSFSVWMFICMEKQRSGQTYTPFLFNWVVQEICSGDKSGLRLCSWHKINNLPFFLNLRNGKSFWLRLQHQVGWKSQNHIGFSMLPTMSKLLW